MVSGSCPFGGGQAIAKNNTIPIFSILPNVAVKEILKLIQDQHTLLNCRVVCVEWNHIIQGTSELIKNIIFPVWHLKPFLDLQIVKNGKMRSISFKDSFRLDPTYINSFINAISNTVEKVVFEFQNVSLENRSELFILILEHRANLQELNVIERYSFNDDEESPGLFVNTGAAASAINTIAAINNICIFSVSKCDFTEEPVGLMELLCKLPELKQIRIDCGDMSRESFIRITEGLNRYLGIYENVLHLNVS